MVRTPRGVFFLESEIPGSWIQGFLIVEKILLLSSTGPSQTALTASWNLQLSLPGSVGQESFPFGDSRKQAQRDHSSLVEEDPTEA